MRKIYYFALILGLLIVTLNVYFLPFFPWPSGIVRPWFMMHGLIPFKDFVWQRTPLDLFILEGWYKIFGATEASYRLFAYVALLLLTLSVWLVLKSIKQKGFIFSFLFYSFLLFPLFLNAEENEILVAIFSLVLFLTLFKYFKKRNKRFILAAGIFSSLCFLTKQNSVFLGFSSLILLGIDSFLIEKKKFLKSFMEKSILYSIGFLTPVILFTLYFFLQNGLSDFLYYTVVFVLGPYRNFEPYLMHGDGIFILAAYLAIIIAFLVKTFRDKSTLSTPQKLLLPFLALSLFPSLLPSYLSYRALTSFPLIAICVGYIIPFSINKKGLYNFVLFFTSFAIFVILISRYIGSYSQFINDTGFVFGAYIKDYGKPELQVVDWLQKNTSANEKIMDYADEIIYLLSNRLPANKYVYPFSYFLKPYDKTFSVFLNNPPKIVIYDESLPKNDSDLSNWPFIPYMKTRYALAAKFGSTLSIYKFLKK